ncbi:variable surface lipoprotein [Mycoplasmopsis bovis]|nr:variable surface lipoprotein [Mycoplasmopsis bovis]QUE42026.1 variable surface lipoprotein [Mycoplasmopsis bovis]QUE43239.1 variable surface lipoprotein [Mycoplasmopsis bovis]
MLWGGGITFISLLPLIAAKCDNKSGNVKTNHPNDRAKQILKMAIKNHPIWLLRFLKRNTSKY